MKRRLVITGGSAALSVGALAVPAAHAAHIAEPIGERIDRLSAELSEALSQSLHGSFAAIVAPAGSSMTSAQLVPVDRLRKEMLAATFLRGCCPVDRIDWHAMEMTRALQAMHGGAWGVAVNHEHRFVLANSWTGDFRPGVYQHIRA